MSKRQKVLPNWKELKEDLKPMTFREKVDHLWTYYKGVLVAVLIVALMVTMTVSAFINANKEIVVSGMVVNVKMTQEGYDYLTKDYFDVLDCEEGKQVVQLLATEFASLADPTSTEDNSYAAQKLILQVTSGDMDYAIVDKMALDFYTNQEVFSDLRTIFPPEMMAEFEERDMLCYSLSVSDDTDLDNLQIDTETADRVPIAVKMDGLAFVEETMHGGEYYFCATSHDPNKEVILGVWEYILAWENR